MKLIAVLEDWEVQDSDRNLYNVESTYSVCGNMTKSKIDKVDRPTVYKDVILNVGIIGLASISKNYVVFEDASTDDKAIHIPLGYFGNSSLPIALKFISNTILKRRLVRKSKGGNIELDEIRKIIESHNRKFDKLLKDADV